MKLKSILLSERINLKRLYESNHNNNSGIGKTMAAIKRSVAGDKEGDEEAEHRGFSGQ